ncbi:MAG: patatin-like phospholipase family protein [Marinobacter sp.]|nr:patatin-like phospholipase family protein [Marinobacter sp.]
MSKFGVVLTGGGARAAYQVGVLKAISDMYPDWDHPFQVIIGTSAGAINAMALAGNQGLFRHNIAHLTKVWSELHMDQVFRADTFGLMRNMSSIARKILTRPSEGGPVSFLNNDPLRTLLKREINFDNIRTAIKSGQIDAVGLNACGYASGQNVCFFEGKEGLDSWTLGQRAGSRCELGLDHIMASSAIPTLFPPVKIHREYFGDGVTRQMAHISPALRLGANKVLVLGVSANAMCPPERPDHPDIPTMPQVLAHVFNGMFLDTLDYDIDRLRLINQLLALVPEDKLNESNLNLERVDLLEISPSEPINDLAMKYVDGLPLVLRRLTGATPGGANASAANLASYLLFDPRFCKALITLGYRDGQSHANQIARFFDRDDNSASG